MADDKRAGGKREGEEKQIFAGVGVEAVEVLL